MEGKDINVFQETEMEGKWNEWKQNYIQVSSNTMSDYMGKQ